MVATLPALADPVVVEQEGPLAPCAKAPDAASDGSAQQATESEFPWAVEIATAFSKEEALDQFNRMKQDHTSVLGTVDPIVVEQCNLSMGTKPQFSARIPAETREAANSLCAKLQESGGACLVQKN